MVKLLSPTTTVTNKEIVPVMFKHQLNCLKDAPTFERGKSYIVFIAKYDHGRYCVWTASFISIPQYHVFESEAELHEHFEEE